MKQVVPERSGTVNDCGKSTTGPSRSRSQTWTLAIHNAGAVILVLLRQSLISSGVAWLLVLCIRSGNILSGVPPVEQSYGEFLTATMVLDRSAFILIGTAIQATHVLVLARRQGSTSVSLLSCLWSVFRASYLDWIVVVLGTIATNAAIQSAPVSVRPYKLEYYIGSCWGVLNTSLMYVRGRQIMQSHATTSPSAAQPRKKRTRSVLKIICHSIFMCLAVTTCGVYVHVADRLRLTTRTRMAWFAVGSYAFKIATQELAKAATRRNGIKDLRVTFMFIGLPTALIDTQLRIVLQRTSDSSLSSFSGMILMVVIEVGLRAIKMAMLRRQLARGPKREDWRQRILTQFAAESYADMSAEYLAIGSATVLLHLYGDHPRYMLVGEVGQTPSILVGQIGMEIVVDLASSAIEISYGLDFAALRHGSWTTLLLIAFGVINIDLTATLYAK